MRTGRRIIRRITLEVEGRVLLDLYMKVQKAPTAAALLVTAEVMHC